MKQLVRSMVLVALSLVTISSTAMAETASGFISTKILPKYVLGNANIPTRKAVSQTITRLNLGNGLYLEAFGSKSLTGGKFGDELDATIGYTRILDKGNRIGIDVGLTYFALYPVLTRTHGDVLKPYIEVSKGFDNNLSTFVKFETYVTLGTKTAPTKTRGSIGVRHMWQITETVRLSQALSTIYENSPVPGVSCVVSQHSATLSWFATPKLSLDILNNTYVPFSGKNKEASVVPGVGATYRF